LASGETPEGAEAFDGLMVLNQMIDALNIQRNFIYTLTITEAPLTPQKQTYTLGTGGDINIDRPAKIERMSIVSLLNPLQPLELPLEMLTDAGWQAIPVKLVTSTLPTQVYDDGAFPFRNLNFWPIPSIPVNIRIYGWTAVSTFPDLFTDVTFPPGYPKMLRYNLAVDLAPEFGRSCPPEVASQAVTTLARIKNMNAPMTESYLDPVLVGRRGQIYNWKSDTWITH